MLRSKVSRTKATSPRRRFSFSKRSNERALTLLEKDLDAVVVESQVETEETALHKKPYFPRPQI